MDDCMTDIKYYLAGNKLYGDDFTAEEIEQWHEDEKEAYAAYLEKLTLLHQMLSYAMKAKQTTDRANVEKLRVLLTKFKNAYFDNHKH